MNSDVPLDYALFQLSPGRTRCELFVSGKGRTEKLASGFIKPFVAHLKVAEEQMSNAVHLIKLDIGSRKNGATWFSKGTVERFVRFVSTPEVLEQVNTFDEEMSQLEGARKIYSLEAGDQFAGESEIKFAAAADATNKELLIAIDVRLIALKQDLATASARTRAAGFSLQSVSELLLFADQFGAFRLSEACNKFLSLHQRRPELINHEHSSLSAAINLQQKSFDDAYVRSSSGSDMSIDQPELEHGCHEAHNFSLNTHQQQQVVGEPITFINEQVEPVQLPGGGSRRLSVQDRINLFECKQKEQLASSKVANASFSSTVINKFAGAKGEHQRNPSDISVEKSVLRRWSGASDMSIDLSSDSNCNNDEKVSGITAGTGTSCTNSLQTVSRNAKTESNVLVETEKCCSFPNSRNSSKETIQTFLSSQHKNLKFLSGDTQNRNSTFKEGITPFSVEPPGLTSEIEQAGTWIHENDSPDRSWQGSLHKQVVSHSRANDFSNSRASAGSIEPKTINSCSASEDPVKEEIVSQFPSRAPALTLTTEPNPATFLTQPTNEKAAGGSAVKTQATSVVKFKPCTNKREYAVEKSKDALDSLIQFEDSMSTVKDASAKASSVNHHTHGSVSFEGQEPRQTNVATPHVPLHDISSEIKQISAFQGVRFLGKSHVTSQRKFQGRIGGKVPIEERNAPVFIDTKFKGGMKTSLSSLEGSHKGNHELGDILQVKTGELERLFTDHKLRIHGDQVASAQRRRNFDDHTNKSVDTMPTQSPPKKMSLKSLLGNVSSNAIEFNHNLLLKIDGKSDFNDDKIESIVNHTPDDSKGELYGKYMQKRDAKLREECGSKRALKEAKMKAMHDSLVHSQAEMKARFTGLSDGQNLKDVLRRAEKMRSFSSRSTRKSKDQMSKSLAGNNGDHDEEELSESSARNYTQIFLPIKTLPPTSRTSVSPISRHSVKSSNSGSLRSSSLKSMVQSENPVTQSFAKSSIPVTRSFAKSSDLKNENIKPSIVVSKATTQRQLRSFSLSKSCTLDAETMNEVGHYAETMNEDGPCLSYSTRKSSANPNQLKDLSSLNSKENFNNFQTGGELKQNPQKGNGAYHMPGAVIVKLETSTIPDELKNKEKSIEFVSSNESSDMVNGNEDLDADGNNLVIDYHIHCDDGKHRNPSQEYEAPKSKDCEVRTLLNSDDSTMNSSKFDSGNANDSSETSSESWNSMVHHSLEAQDIDASVGFLTNSPVSWNSQMMDFEATRMRKKWGNAQIPVVAASSYHQSHRGVSKGINQFLKFGRKNRCTEHLVNDSVSASTASVGDDDLGDGRDVVHPSDGLRKSSKGYSITSYDGYDEGSIFPEECKLAIT